MLQHLTTLATLLAAGGLALAQNPTPVQEALAQYKAAVVAAKQAQLGAGNTLKEKYTAALTRLKASLDPSADTQALLAVAAEIENLSNTEPVKAGAPGEKLLAARATYQTAQEKIQLTTDAKIVTATDAAIVKLRQLTGSLAAANDLDAALVAEQERRNLEANEDYLASKERMATASTAARSDQSSRLRGDLNEAIPRTGLVAYFPFEGRLDDTKGDTILKMGGVKRFAAGISGRALNLARPSEGDRPNIGFPLPDGGRTDFSVSYCIKPDMSAHSQKVIFSAGKEGDATRFWVNYRQSGTVGADLGYNPPGDGWHSTHAKLPRPEPAWHHVAITVTKEEATYYLDGKRLLTMKPNGQRLNLTGMHGYIGTFRDWNGSGGDRELSYSGGPDMLVDELSIYTRELNAAEARSLAKNYGLFDDGRSTTPFSRPRRGR